MNDTTLCHDFTYVIQSLSIIYTKIDKIEKKLDHHHGNKYFTTQEFNNLTAKNFEV